MSRCQIITGDDPQGMIDRIYALEKQLGESNLRIKQLEQALRGVKVLLERCIRADDFKDALTTINSVLGGEQ